MQIECNLYQNPKGAFCRNKKRIPKISIETHQKTHKCKKKKKWKIRTMDKAGDITFPWFQTILWHQRNWNSLALNITEDIHGSMWSMKHNMWPVKYNRELRYKPSVYSQLIFGKNTKMQSREKVVSSTKSVK